MSIVELRRLEASLIEAEGRPHEVRLYVAHGAGYSFEEAFRALDSAKAKKAAMDYVRKHYGDAAVSSLTFAPQGTGYTVARLPPEE